MPTVMRIGAFRLYFYSHEPNEPPHVHVDRGDATMRRCDDATIKIWLGSMEVAKSRGFRAHEIGDIVAMVEDHRVALTEAWHEHFG